MIKNPVSALFMLSLQWNQQGMENCIKDENYIACCHAVIWMQHSLCYYNALIEVKQKREENTL